MTLRRMLRMPRRLTGLLLVIALSGLSPVSYASAQTSPAPDPCLAPPATVPPWNSGYLIGTTWEPSPGAPVERVAAGTLGSPTPVNVDADPQVDLVVTLSAGTTGVVLDVVRAPGETAALPVSVQATVYSPGPGDPAARRYTIGYDARGDRAPDAFRVAAQIAADGEQRFVVTQQGPGSRIALVSSLVVGGACTRPVDFRIDFGSSPAEATVRAKVGHEVRVILLTGTSGPVTVTTRRALPVSEERVRVVIEPAPGQLSLVVTPHAGTIAFEGSAAVARLATAIDTAAPGPLGANHIEANLVGVPGSVALSLLPSDNRLVLRSTQPITEVDVRARSDNRAFPQLPAGEVGVILDATGGGLSMAVRAIELRLLDVSIPAGLVVSEMQGGRRLLVDTQTDVFTFDVVADLVPSSFRAGFEAARNANRLVVSGSSPMGFVRLVRTGAPILPGAVRIEAELTGVPVQVAVTLPTLGPGLSVRASNEGGVPTPIGQLRLVASDGTKALPAFVSDAQFNANPTNTSLRDRLETDTSAPAWGVVLRLTAVKTLDFTLEPLAISLTQDGARTRPLLLDVKAPNRQTGAGTRVVTGLLNRPSASTVVAVDIAPDRPTRLRLENAAPMASLALSATNLGTVPAADLALSNIPTRLSVCMHTDGQCRPTDRLPTPLQDYAAFQDNPAQSATAGGGNRPYPAQVSLSFDDFGTSGTGSTPSSMVTLNATIRMTATDPPIIITNLRFHRLALDVGVHPSSQTFLFQGGTFPRIYLYLDSGALPFVMNEVRYPGLIESFRVGTDGQPAIADRRLVWLPGTRCAAFVFGSCVTTALDMRASGSLNCGGQRQFVVRVSGFSFNLLNMQGQSLPICS